MRIFVASHCLSSSLHEWRKRSWNWIEVKIFQQPWVFFLANFASKQEQKFYCFIDIRKTQTFFPRHDWLIHSDNSWHFKFYNFKSICIKEIRFTSCFNHSSLKSAKLTMKSTIFYFFILFALFGAVFAGGDSSEPSCKIYLTQKFKVFI